MTICRLMVAALIPWLAAMGGVALAQDRDPTRAPGDVSVPATAEVRGTGSLPAGMESMSVMVRDGAHYLVVGTRLLGVGQTLGDYKIDRITETEIWLRRGKELRKVSRFGAIQRRAASPVTPAQP